MYFNFMQNKFFLKTQRILSKLSSKNKALLKRGFTLLELMIVLVILGALMTIFIVSFDFGDDQEQVHLHNLSAKAQLTSALYRFRQSCGRYPTELEGLRALTKDASLETEDCPPRNYLLNKNMLKDYYNGPYEYRVSDTGDYVILSLGADHQEGGEGSNADVNLNSVE